MCSIDPKKKTIYIIYIYIAIRASRPLLLDLLQDLLSDFFRVRRPGAEVAQLPLEPLDEPLSAALLGFQFGLKSKEPMN